MNIVHALESVVMLQQAVHIFTTALQRVNWPNNSSAQYELVTPPWNNMRNTNTDPGNCTYHTIHIYIYVCVCACVVCRVWCGVVWCEPHRHITHHTDTPHTTHNAGYNCLLALRPTQCRCKCSIGSLDVQPEAHKTAYNYYPPLGIMWPLTT